MLKTKFLPLLVIFLLSSCQEKMIFKLSEDPGYVDNPILSVKALDGDRWVEGYIDEDTKSIDFQFRVIEDFSNVTMKVELNGKWPRMVSPEAPVFEADLNNLFKISVNDGVDLINYEVTAARYDFVKGVTLVMGGATIECDVNYLSAYGKFNGKYLYSDLTDIKVEVELADNTLLLHDETELAAVDFTQAGESLNLKIKDTVTGHIKTLAITAVPEDVVSLDEAWSDVTASYKKEHGLSTLSPDVRIYVNDELNNVTGNIGYLMTIPAGMVEMKVLEKSHLGSDEAAKISSVVRSNRDYSVFFYLQGPAVWHIDGSTASSGHIHYSPLAYSSGEVLRQEGWGGSAENTMYAPALAVKDGKAMIAPAKTDMAAGKLYRYEDAQGTGQQDWSDVDCAIGGYFLIVKDGDNLITGRGDVFVQYSHAWRSFPGYDSDGNCLLTNFASPSWSASVPVTTHDALRISRHAVGVTSRGDLVLFSAEKYENTHNQGQGRFNGMNGDAKDQFGVTLSELSYIMSEMGCSEAMTLEDAAWCSFVLQDNGDRGHDLFMVNRRWTFSTGERRAESDEYVNLAIACFK